MKDGTLRQTAARHKTMGTHTSFYDSAEAAPDFMVYLSPHNSYTAQIAIARR